MDVVDRHRVNGGERDHCSGVVTNVVDRHWINGGKWDHCSRVNVAKDGLVVAEIRWHGRSRGHRRECWSGVGWGWSWFNGPAVVNAGVAIVDPNPIASPWKTLFPEETIFRSQLEVFSHGG